MLAHGPAGDTPDTLLEAAKTEILSRSDPILDQDDPELPRFRLNGEERNDRPQDQTRKAQRCASS